MVNLILFRNSEMTIMLTMTVMNLLKMVKMILLSCLPIDDEDQLLNETTVCGFLGSSPGT